jgi:type I restriction enzyme S subunit
VQQSLLDHLDVWTKAIETRSTSGRGNRSKLHLYGIKKLRELILDLAVRGKLVPQDPNDEPARVLLERIEAERARLEKEENLRTKAENKIYEHEKYIESPKNWQYLRLGNLTKFIDYRGKTPKKINEGIPLITAKNIKKGHINKYPAEFISKEDYITWMTRGFPRKGDILFTTEAPLGNVAIVNTDKKFALAQRAICFQVHEPKVSNFLIYFIMSQTFQKRLLENATGTTAKGINASKLKEIPVIIPPLAEQHRIVAKVNELMSLCDALEQAQTQHIQAHQTLVENLLAALTQAANQGDFEQAWARIAEHFDTLFTTEHSIDQLKQTVLQLAVMGKLVPQDPNDEPASVLLEKITAEKTRLIKEKKIKKQKALPPIADEEKPFELPDGWAWCRLDNLSLNSEAGWSPKCKPTPREGNKWGILKVSAVTWDIFNPEENKELPSHFEPRKHLEVKRGDFLISRANTSELVAKAVVVPENAPSHLIMSDKIIRFTFSESICKEFVNWANNSQLSRSYYLNIAGGTSSSMKNVSREQVRSLLIPLPPLQEQERIAKKINKFTTLCDQLKAQLAKQQTTQNQLADALTTNVYPTKNE